MAFPPSWCVPPGPLRDAAVFVYPYHVATPAVVQDVGLGPVGTAGNLELSYLVAFYGDEGRHEAARMLAVW